MRTEGCGQVRLCVDLDAQQSRCCSMMDDDDDPRPIGDTPPAVLRMLMNVRDEMVRAGGARWCRCVFILKPDNTYHLGIEYGA